MGREARDRRDRLPHLHPVERIELNKEHIGRRLIAAVGLLILGAGLLTYAIVGLMTPETGWQTVQASANAGPTCAEDFTFLYEINSAAETREVTNFYTSACQKGYRLFHSDQEFENVVNVYTINRHPNEELEVDPGLYAAFSAIVESGRRELYMGPVYERYDDLFFLQDDSLAAEFDPRLSENVREEYAGVLVYANDPQAVNLELLGDNRIRLYVSEEYLAWADREEIDRFIDFAWMRNAFLADYLAAVLTERGFTRGTLNSYDGFVRNLDGSGTEYSYSIYHRQDGIVFPAASLRYYGPMSFVRMRDYPISEQDSQHYYQTTDGEVRTSYLDTADALCRSAVDTLACYSREKGCAQILLEMIPVYIADEFQEEAVSALAKEGVASIYCQGSVVRYTEPGALLGNFFEGDGVQYTAKQVELP